jgi:transposase
MKTTALAIAPASTVCNVSVDVGLEKLNLVCPAIARPDFRPEWEILNRTEPIRTTLELILRFARCGGFTNVRIVVEPTGIYHRTLLRIARALGCETAFVNAAHVVAMRTVVFGDKGKTDRRDPIAIDAVAQQGRLILHRELPETYQLMRHWSKLYEDAEHAIINAKSCVHRVLTQLFPDFSFGVDFLFGDSGTVIFRSFGFHPHRIIAHAPSRIHERLRRTSTIRRSSVDRLLAEARSSAAAVPAGRATDLLAHELALAWTDLETAIIRRAGARAALESLYTEARGADSRLPGEHRGFVSTLSLARFFAETGPLDDFESYRQVLKFGGLNLAERKSGKYVGVTKISRCGRVRLRSVLNQMTLPLVKRDRLYGPFYHHKTGVEKMPGKQAMTAVARKLVKVLWGIYHSGGAFDVKRVFLCASAYQQSVAA